MSFTIFIIFVFYFVFLLRELVREQERGRSSLGIKAKLMFCKSKSILEQCRIMRIHKNGIFHRNFKSIIIKHVHKDQARIDLH